MTPVAARLQAIGALDVVRRIAAGYHVPPEHVVGRERYRNAARARHHAWMVLRHTTDMSWPHLAKLWGYDHASVMSGVREAEARLAEEYAR